MPRRPPVTVHQSEHQPFCRNYQCAGGTWRFDVGKLTEISYREIFQDNVSTKLRSHRPSPESGILLKENGLS